MISGAKYSGVPQNEYVLLPLPFFSSPYFDKPKSVIFRCPECSSKIFSGFKSLKYD
jgi:hypothetical protein